MTGSFSQERSPLFSIVSACYNVARFLPDFIASIDAQDIDASLIEVIAVDDGSTDKTHDVLETWRRRRPDLVRIVQQENAGQSSARNTGIELARGEWITFPDPDDFLDPDYLSRVAAAIASTPDLDMVATARWLHDDFEGVSTDTHPLRSHFKTDQVVNLAVRESFFHGSSPCAFFRRERVMAEGLRYDPRIRPTFEDGHFCATYLLAKPAPLVAFLTTRYHYRKRADGTSTLQTALSHPGRYTNVLRHGSLALLEDARERHGRIPLWLQTMIIYEINNYAGREDSVMGTIAPVELREEFHELMAQIVGLLEPEVVASYRRTHLSQQTRDVIQHAWGGRPWHSPTVYVTEYDESAKLLRLVYRWVGPEPSEEIEFGGRAVVPHAAKRRDIQIQGRTVMHEKILWLSARRFRIRLDGRLVPVTYGSVRSHHLHPKLKDLRLLNQPVETDTEPVRPPRRARSRVLAQRFENAWTLQDRIHNAEDNAEHLFRHLRTNRLDINAWFVVEKGTPCWIRLRKEFGDRVIAHGSDEWIALMLNTRHLISSHADLAITKPVALKGLQFQPKFTFLQHGVTKDDLSGWLNQRNISTLLSSTQAEHEGFVGDGTSYRVTSREVQLTGLPRFDALTRTSKKFPEGARDLVLLAPTWRDHLSAPLRPGSQRRFPIPGYEESTYWKQWTGLIESKELQRIAESRGLKVALLPHPNLENAYEQHTLPDHLERFRYGAGLDVAELFSRSAVLVTDFSSVAFDAAYIERPIVYFHCDVDPSENSRHVGIPGYFDYREHGFGPVCHEIEETEREITETLDFGGAPREPWRGRIREAFPFRDAKNCARATAAILRSDKPVRITLADD